MGETMPYQANRSLRRVVTVGVSLAIACFVGVLGASANPGDTFDGFPEVATVVEENEGMAPAAPAEVKSSSRPVERAPSSQEAVEGGFIEDYDPWEPFNESMFSFNRKLDQFVMKPVAKAWDKILPDPVERGLKNALDNLSMPRRLVNNLLQLRFTGAGRELARFLVNSTVGLAGVFDPAKGLGIEASKADTGQTLGVYGVGAGPYLVLPFLPPLTVRDGIGLAVDSALDPFNYVLFPAVALTGAGAGERVNDRALNLELFETVEETTIDLYSAVRNAYLQRRQKAIEEGRPVGPSGRQSPITASTEDSR